MHVTSGGAGGWGNALDRDPESVLLDVQRNWVSLEQAEEQYGVRITIRFLAPIRFYPHLRVLDLKSHWGFMSSTKKVF